MIASSCSRAFLNDLSRHHHRVYCLDVAALELVRWKTSLFVFQEIFHGQQGYL